MRADEPAGCGASACSRCRPAGWRRCAAGCRRSTPSSTTTGASPGSCCGRLVIAVIFQLNRCLLVGGRRRGPRLVAAVRLLRGDRAGRRAGQPHADLDRRPGGTRSWRIVYLFGLVGMPAETALALALLIRVSGLLLLLPGAWFYVRRGIYA